MFSRKRPSIGSEQPFIKRKMEVTEEENLEGEDEAEGSQCDFRLQQQSFPCEHARSMGHDPRPFNTQYLNIGYGNEFGPTYHPNMIQHHVPCGIGAFAYTRGDFHNPNVFFQQQMQGGDGIDNDEDFCLATAKSEDLEARMIRKIDVPLFFIGDPTFANSTTIDPREIYCTVPGRTSLLSSTTKYRVTVGEIQRRISPPECLNASLLGGILRKAKSKDGGKTLRDSLRKIGLTLPAGRRKQANVTAWTALVEEEAVHMAKDFAVVCEKEFHAREIGIYMTKANLAIDHDVIKRRTILEHSKKIICELGDLMAADRTPLTSYLATTRQTALLDQSIQQHLSHFTLVTHGFGGVAMVAALDSIKLVIEESLKYLDRTCPQHMYLGYGSR